MGRVEELLHGSDGNVRGVSLHVQSGDRRPILLRRPVQHIYPIETDVVPSGLQEPVTDQGERLVDPIIEEDKDAHSHRPRRAAAQAARFRIQELLND